MTWDRVRTMAKHLMLRAKGNPFGSAASLHLQPGLYLIEVTVEKTLWVSIPYDESDRRLSLGDACEQLMKPALAALRAHQSEQRLWRTTTMEQPEQLPSDPSDSREPRPDHDLPDGPEVDPAPHPGRPGAKPDHDLPKKDRPTPKR